MEPDLDKLIYLDAEYISRKYEEIKQVSPGNTFTKQEGASAGIRVPLLNAGVHTQESRTFTVSSRKMLMELWQDLNKNYQSFDAAGFKNNQGTRILWMKGILTLAEWKMNNEPGYEFYQLDHGSESTAFLTHKEYFAAGFTEVLEASVALKGNVAIPVKCLVRVMWHVDIAKNYTACPYLIVEDTEIKPS